MRASQRTAAPACTVAAGPKVPHRAWRLCRNTARAPTCVSVQAEAHEVPVLLGGGSRAIFSTKHRTVRRSRTVSWETTCGPAEEFRPHGATRALLPMSPAPRPPVFAAPFRAARDKRRCEFSIQARLHAVDAINDSGSSTRPSLSAPLPPELSACGARNTRPPGCSGSFRSKTTAHRHEEVPKIQIIRRKDGTRRSHADCATPKPSATRRKSSRRGIGKVAIDHVVPLRRVHDPGQLRPVHSRIPVLSSVTIRMPAKQRSTVGETDTMRVPSPTTRSTCRRCPYEGCHRRR